MIKILQNSHNHGIIYGMIQQAEAEWLRFKDPHDPKKNWLFDATFLLSNWSCIFGKGCKGVLDHDATSLNQGCCSHGAHLIDAKEEKKIQKLAKKLPDNLWQFAKIARKKGVTKRTKADEIVTRKVDGACIFLNRPEFHTSAGCALHLMALEENVSPYKYKPTVCWQVPIKVDYLNEDHDYELTIVRQWERRDWGEGGEDFHWWCTESPDAFVGKVPCYVALKDELTEICGKELYESLAKELTRIKNTVRLTHPGVRRK
jgi:hypothetical protein